LKASIDVKHHRRIPGTASEPIQPSDKDVLLVYGTTRSYNHPGTIAFKRCVKESGLIYEQSSGSEKKRIRVHIYLEFKNKKGSRFLAYAKESGLWYEVSDKQALEVISAKLAESGRDYELKRLYENRKTEICRDDEPDKKPKLETNSDTNASMIRSDRMDTTD